MGERHNTGGTREFHYNKEDLHRIRSTDTESTKAFKEAYKDWEKKRVEERKIEAELRKSRQRLTFFVIFLFALVLVLLALRFWK